MAPLNVTPMSLMECVKTILKDDDVARRQLEALQHQYAAGSIRKDEVQTAMGQIAGPDVVVEALRILVPGYDEMCGRSPAPAPATPPDLPPADISDGVPSGQGPVLSLIHI